MLATVRSDQQSRGVAMVEMVRLEMEAEE